jgi:hypothetical protein
MGEHTTVFVEGVHYPLGKDGEPDLSKPLRWENGDYRPAVKDEPLHNDVHGSGDTVLDPGSEDA